MYTLRTIDVWDTLLRRSTHPDAIKLITAQHLSLKEGALLAPHQRTHWQLYAARLKLERVLARQAKSQGHDGEYNIEQVMQAWVQSVAPWAIADGLPHHLSQYELSVELGNTYPDPDIAEWLKHSPAQRTLFLSDFYMGQAAILELLKAHGLDDIASEGLVSSDIGLNKRSGRLFGHVHALLGVTPSQHLHIGDNKHADVRSPKRLGIHAIRYLPNAQHALRLQRESLFSQSRSTLFNHVQAQCVTHAMAHPSSAWQFGMQVAPVFVGFALYIAEQAIEQKLDALFFLTREGEFFLRVFQALFPDNTLCGHALPPPALLEVSRLSTFAPSMAGISLAEMDRIWALFKLQSIAGLFTTLRLDISAFSHVLASLHLKPTDVITNPQDSPQLKELFNHPQFIAAATTALQTQAGLLRSYLQARGVAPGLRAGVIDIGWRGTIQDNLALLCRDVQWQGMYLGLRRFINPQPRNGEKCAYVVDENASPRNDHLFRNFAAMEMLCTSPNGSVAGYAQCKDGDVVAERTIDTLENAAFDTFVAAFQHGVIEAASLWRPYLERYAVSSQEMHGIALDAWQTILKHPPDTLVEVFMQTPQHDAFGYGETFKRDNAPSMRALLLAPVSRPARQTVVEFVRRVQWSEAIRNSAGLGRVHRALLYLTFRAGHFIKDLRNRT